MLQILNLNASIGEKKILNNISFTVNPGEVLLITGHNGSGKSTLLHTIMGRYDIEATGSITLSGEALNELECHERANKGVFMFHQSPPTIDGVNTMTLLNEINKVNEMPYTRGELIAQAGEKFSDMKLPDDWKKRQFNAGASGGERKKNELVQAQLFNSKLLLLDEPDSGLEQASRQKIIELISKTREAGGIVLLVTHDKDLQEHYAGNIIELYNGNKL